MQKKDFDKNPTLFHNKVLVVLLVGQSFPSLCNPMDCSPPGSYVHGTHQARKLEWVAIPFSRGFLNPGIKHRSPTLQADYLPSELQG